MKIKLGVIFGGTSVEHEVSIISAVQAMQSMDQNKYDIIPIYIAKDRTWYTGKMLMDIDVYKDFEDLKRYASKVVLYKKDNSFVLQKLGLFKSVVEELDVVFPIVHGAGVEDVAFKLLAADGKGIGIEYLQAAVLDGRFDLGDFLGGAGSAGASES